jgi:predicted metal-binding membrane protein
MMVGMMAVPAQRVDRGVVPAVPSLGLGYLIVWLAFSACATAAQWALHEGALLSSTMAT